VDLPRLAILHNWIDTQDAGWARGCEPFEQLGMDKPKTLKVLIVDAPDPCQLS